MKRLFDVLFGRTLPEPARTDKLFALATAYVELQEDYGLTSTGRAGIAYRPVESSFFDEAQAELRGVLQITGRETGTAVAVRRDAYGYEWVVFSDPDFEDLVSTAHVVARILEDHGFGPQVLAALFEFTDGAGRRVYIIYNYKRGSFYPFVPRPGKDRDVAYELRLKALLADKLPLEADLSRWFPLWDPPLDPGPDLPADSRLG